MAKLNTRLLLTLTSLTLMIGASACLGGSSSNSCDPEFDDCVCTLDDDGITEVDDCLDRSTDNGEACSCDFDDSRRDPNPEPTTPGPGPDTDPDRALCTDACVLLIECSNQGCPGELGIGLADCVEQCEPDPVGFQADIITGLSCDEINDSVCPEPAPVLLNRVVRASWHWRSDPDNVVSFYTGQSQFAAFDNLVAEPGPIAAVLEGRRLIGGDCVAYVENDRTQRESRGPWPVPAQRQSDIGIFTNALLDVNGNELFQLTQRFDEGSGQYPFSSIFESRDNPTPAAGQVRFNLQNNGPIRTEDGGTVRSMFRAEPIAWNLNGTQFELSPSDDAPAMYLSFDMIGDDARAHVHCARAVSGGVARFTIPDINALADEIGWDDDREPPQAGFCGVTNITDPRRSGLYGVVEQALSGPAFMFEEVNKFTCGFGN